MTAPRIDFRAVFAVTPSPYLLLAPDFVVAEVNDAYLRVTGRTREEVMGRDIFQVHPDNPADPAADGVRNLRASLGRVLRSKRPDTMAVQKYDIPAPGRTDAFRERWWSPINTPVLGPDGEVAWIIHRVEDVTGFVRARSRRPDTGGTALAGETMGPELYARAQELQQFNDELREAHDRERLIALTLQRAMLHSPDLAGHREIALRYMPAARSMNVCGDWYDVVDLSEDTFTVAVGDVVGHGLEAAAVMGMLRSALSAAVRAIPEPGRAMDVLSRYARTFEGALATTAAKAVVDTRTRRITYTCAGHPPPMLCRRDGTVITLDQATDPPLGIRLDDHPRPQATVPYDRGDTLVLYTDGLVERRGEDIDVGLRRLGGTLARHTALGPDDLADVLLSRLGVAQGGPDDIALIVVRL
ncbi:putative magnesium or manganese-dependent protein phosphatase [Actinacidiphila reveromycinica]|uniref:Putative magnesium or manganese-dependent protein phosphatase n=1 Tax=Actinacidiphila reveromycinica TaxID=659352 RepID=A0A7U3VLJ2_9ACTN|nr:SpoIIE family protein phosphatase [Streptomyces sp. SN-593]BBA95589.1 putative magnesium or manganese-dependent protein phosphatase [Streptomyces sp. SN-593]